MWHKTQHTIFPHEWNKQISRNSVSVQFVNDFIPQASHICSLVFWFLRLNVFMLKFHFQLLISCFLFFFFDHSDLWMWKFPSKILKKFLKIPLPSEPLLLLRLGWILDLWGLDPGFLGVRSCFCFHLIFWWIFDFLTLESWAKSHNLF